MDLVARHLPFRPVGPAELVICSRIPVWTVSTALNTDSMCRARISAVLASSRWFSIRTRLCRVERKKPVPVAITAERATAQMMVNRIGPIDMLRYRRSPARKPVRAGFSLFPSSRAGLPSTSAKPRLSNSA
jgi:hypothetical protein